jgi:hypothetical protein
VEYLLRRDEDVQDRLEEVNRSLKSMPGRWPTDITEAWRRCAAGRRALEQMRDRSLKARLLGVALLVGVHRTRHRRQPRQASLVARARQLCARERQS